MRRGALVKVLRLDGTTALAQFWGFAPAPRKTVERRWYGSQGDAAANSRDLGLPKGGADYLWLVLDDGTALRAARPKATGELVEIPDRVTA